MRSVLVREGFGQDIRPLLADITWVFPSRPLTGEFERITAVGYLKGADLWHVACALFLDPEVRQLAFLTLDRRQKEVAAELGFSF